LPFTPFHMGPAMVGKACGGAAFSLLLFGYTQVLIDVEALIHIYQRDAYLHGFPHSFLGATLIGLVALLTGKPICSGLCRIWQAMARNDQGKQTNPQFLNWKQATLTVLLGAWSHVVLDAIMHADMRPFAPFSDANPFLQMVSTATLHQICLISGLIGVILIAGRYFRAGSK